MLLLGCNRLLVAVPGSNPGRRLFCHSPRITDVLPPVNRITLATPFMHALAAVLPCVNRITLATPFMHALAAVLPSVNRIILATPFMHALAAKIDERTASRGARAIIPVCNAYNSLADYFFDIQFSEGSAFKTDATFGRST
jgi:hypothetical protein